VERLSDIDVPVPVAGFVVLLPISVAHWVKDFSGMKKVRVHLGM
jgi:hypothetical protein